MIQHPRQHSWMLLIPLLAACSWAQATPPTAAIATPVTVVAAPAPAVPTVALQPTIVARAATSVLSQTPMTSIGDVTCQQLGASTLPTCVALPLVTTLPLDQALRQFTSRALLYQRFPNILMIDDPDSGASLWINREACPPRVTLALHGAWSADGQFIAFSCQNGQSWTLDLLDMQTADMRRIAAGDAVDFAWSPTGHRLLVAEQTAVQRAFVLDATTDTTTALPFAPLWEFHDRPYAPSNVTQAVPLDDGTAAMAWSPDGTRIAVIGECICLLDADMAHVRDGKLAVLMPFEGGAVSRPRWSHDGRFLYTVEPYENRTDPLAGSSRYGAIALRTEMSTGVISSVTPEPLWSPDNTAYVAAVPTTASADQWALYQADGTLMRVLADGPFWTPDSQQVVIQTPAIRRPQLSPSTGPVTNKRFSPRTKTWASYGSITRRSRRIAR